MGFDSSTLLEHISDFSDLQILSSLALTAMLAISERVIGIVEHTFPSWTSFQRAVHSDYHSLCCIFVVQVRRVVNLMTKNIDTLLTKAFATAMIKPRQVIASTLSNTSTRKNV